jgi:hypothetical protein
MKGNKDGRYFRHSDEHIPGGFVSHLAEDLLEITTDA